MDDLTLLLQMMLVIALRDAARVPTPADPPDDEWNRAADAYVRLAARTEDFEEMSPEAAAALIPRVRFALPFAQLTQKHLDRSLGRPATAGETLEWILIEQWHEVTEPKWLAGELE